MNGCSCQDTLGTIVRVKSNYHTHCDFCDGKGSPQAMAEAAWKAGFGQLGFSSHAPLEFAPSWTMNPSRMGEYISTIRDLAGAWKPQGLEILLGLEIDWIEGRSSPRDEAYRDLDYRIGSLHFVQPGSGEAFAVDEPEEDLLIHIEREAGGDARLLYRHYYRNLAKMVDEGGFEILGHFDLPRKHNKHGALFDEEGKEYLGAAMEAVEMLAGRGIVVEINTGGMIRGKTSSPYPALAVLTRMRELGVRITFCEDAHHPAHLGMFRKEAMDHALAAGYRSLAQLCGGQWVERGLDD